jgi:hypothetical protein
MNKECETRVEVYIVVAKRDGDFLALLVNYIDKDIKTSFGKRLLTLGVRVMRAKHLGESNVGYGNQCKKDWHKQRECIHRDCGKGVDI